MYWTTQELEARGWTKSLIKRFLPEPHSTKNLGRYCVQYLYGQNTVGEIEATDEFKELQTKALNRRVAGIKSAQKRKVEYLDYLKNRMPVRVVVKPLDEVKQDACNSYNVNAMYRSQFQSDYDDYSWRPASLKSDDVFLERITVNYIRHNLTRYDGLLRRLKGKQAKEEAHEIIQRRVFEAIAEHYPDLREECDRQMIRRGFENRTYRNRTLSEYFVWLKTLFL